MILLRRKDFPVPALPVKKMFCPLLTVSRTVVCSFDNLTGFVTASGKLLSRNPEINKWKLPRKSEKKKDFSYILYLTS